MIAEENYKHPFQLNIADYNIIVNPSYKDDDGLLLNLFKSLLSVKRKYILYTDSKSGKTLYHTERVFAYELYRQWNNRIQFTNPDFIINGEVEKSPKLYNAVYRKMHTFPDLVMHHSQGDGLYQGVVCEIKTNKVGVYSFIEDIDKLNLFVCGRTKDYRFDYGVFILAGANITHILDIMDEIDNHEFKACIRSRNKRIICAAYDGNQLQTVRFDWLISKKNRNQLRNSIM